jgi:methyltransferase
MGVSVACFEALLAAVGVSRLAELAISRRHQLRLANHHVLRRWEPHYRWMVALHVVVLAGAAFEVIALKRPFVPIVAVCAAAIFLFGLALRWWAIRSLGVHWNVQVMDSAPLGVVITGPFRWIRHPNYLGVFLELSALPMIHCAYIAALLAVAGNIWVLKDRLRVEEPMLAAHSEYRQAMGGKARFVPGIF